MDRGVVEYDELLLRRAIVDLPAEQAREVGERPYGGEAECARKEVTIVLRCHGIARGKLPNDAVGTVTAYDDVVGLNQPLYQLLQFLARIRGENGELDVLEALRSAFLLGKPQRKRIIPVFLREHRARRYLLVYPFTGPHPRHRLGVDARIRQGPCKRA